MHFFVLLLNKSWEKNMKLCPYISYFFPYSIVQEKRGSTNLPCSATRYCRCSCNYLYFERIICVRHTELCALSCGMYEIWMLHCVRRASGDMHHSRISFAAHTSHKGSNILFIFRCLFTRFLHFTFRLLLWPSALPKSLPHFTRRPQQHTEHILEAHTLHLPSTIGSSSEVGQTYCEKFYYY